MEGAEVQAQGDLIIYRASSLGACAKRLVALRLGYEPLPVPEAFQSRFSEGHLHEAAVLELMEKEGWKLYDQQRTVGLDISSKIRVVGHIDAKGYHLTKGWLVEVKSQSEEEFRRFGNDGWEGGLFPKYKWQVSVYMLATGLGLCLVRKNRNTGEVKTEYLLEPFYRVEDIRRRVLEIESWASRGELPDCSSKDFPCPVSYLHEREDREQLDDSSLDVLARQYELAGRDEKVAVEKKKTTRGALEEAMGDVTKAETKAGYKITFFEVARKNLSKKLLTDSGLDPDDYTTTTVSKQLRITPPKEDHGTGGSEAVDSGGVGQTAD